MSDLTEKVARALYKASNAGASNCWAWDDSGLDDEHPGARDRYLRLAAAAIAAMRDDSTPPADRRRAAHD